MSLDPQVVIAFSALWLTKDYSYSCTLNPNQSTHWWAMMPLVSVQISVGPHILKPWVIVSTDITASLWDVFTGVRGTVVSLVRLRLLSHQNLETNQSAVP